MTEEIDLAIDRVFSLGMNCHLKTKFEHNKTKIEIEKLFNNIKAAEKEKKVTIKNEERLTCELKRFGLKRRDFTKDLIQKKNTTKSESSTELITSSSEKQTKTTHLL